MCMGPLQQILVRQESRTPSAVAAAPAMLPPLSTLQICMCFKIELVIALENIEKTSYKHLQNLFNPIVQHIPSRVRDRKVIHFT